jgi:hypothetical protein
MADSYSRGRERSHPFPLDRQRAGASGPGRFRADCHERIICFTPAATCRRPFGRKICRVPRSPAPCRDGNFVVPALRQTILFVACGTYNVKHAGRTLRPRWTGRAGVALRSLVASRQCESEHRQTQGSGSHCSLQPVTSQGAGRGHFQSPILAVCWSLSLSVSSCHICRRKGGSLALGAPVGCLHRWCNALEGTTPIGRDILPRTQNWSWVDPDASHRNNFSDAEKRQTLLGRCPCGHIRESD